MKPNVTLGQMIHVEKKLVRGHKQSIYGHNSVNRLWFERPIVPCECMIIGIRTLTNGHAWFDGEVRGYEQLQWITALVVVKRLSSNPFYILVPEELNVK